MLCCITQQQIDITVFIRDKRQIVSLKILKNRTTISHSDKAVCLW